MSSSTARGETVELLLIPFPYSSAKSYRAIDGDAQKVNGIRNEELRDGLKDLVGKKSF